MTITFYVVCELLRRSYNCNICKIKREIKRMSLLELGTWTLSVTDQPKCSACHCPLTVKHILIECPAMTSTRNKHFTASSMKDLFDNVAARNIINFIKESHFYRII